jgi:hypothetical protein
MRISCIFDSIVGKMSLILEKSITKGMRVSINSKEECQPATHARNFKMPNALDVVQIVLLCVL